MFPIDRIGTDPPGEPIADFIVEHLTKSGCRVNRRRSTDYSHTFDVHVGKVCFNAAVGLVDDGDREWLFFADSTLGWFTRLFRTTDALSHYQVLMRVHEALSYDPRISEVRWYTADEWNTNPSDGVGEPTA